VHRFDTELDALRFANQNNRTYLADRLAHPDDEVMCIAVVSDASPALPTEPLRETGVETLLSHTERLNLVGRWFEGRGMMTMAHICRTAAKELKSVADRREEAVAQVVSSGPADMPLLQWISADHSFRTPIGSKLYATPCVAWQPIETAPKDGTEILAICRHEADPYHDGDGLTAYGARCEGLGHVDDGMHVIAWEEAREESDGWESPSYWVPAGWVHNANPELMANPTHWMPLPACSAI
jgi:hypothetical protein